MVSQAFTVADLEGFPVDETRRYEIIDGELEVTTQPHFQHQFIVGELSGELRAHCQRHENGVVIPAPGVIFSDIDAVAPDLVWMTTDRFRDIALDDGKLHGPPNLVIEVLSAGWANEKRDLHAKVKLYAKYSVDEYWIIDWRAHNALIYRRTGPAYADAIKIGMVESLTSPQLPGFSCELGSLFLPR